MLHLHWSDGYNCIRPVFKSSLHSPQTSSGGEGRFHVSYKRQPFRNVNFPSVHAQVSVMHSYCFLPNLRTLLFSLNTTTRKSFFILNINHIQAIAILQDLRGHLNMYTSDSTGVKYTLSLEDLVHDSYYIDLNVVSSLVICIYMHLEKIV